MRVEFNNECLTIDFTHAVGVGERIPRQITTKRDERVHMFAATQWGDITFDQQHMVAIVADGIWAAPRQRRINWHAGAAGSTT